MGALRWRQEAAVEAREAFERALALLPPGGREAAEVRLQLAELEAASFSRPGDGLVHAERALAIVRPLRDPRLEAAACTVAGNVRVRAGDLEAGRALLERGLALAGEADDPVQAAEASLANVSLWLGDVGGARRAQERREELARRTQDPYQLRHVYTWLGAIHSYRGEWDDAVRLFGQAGRALERLDSPEPQAFLRAIRAGQDYRLGRFAEAEAGYRAVVDVLRGQGSGTVVWYLASHGLALVELGRPDEARARRTEAGRLVAGLDEGSVARGFALTGQALLSAALGALTVLFTYWLAAEVLPRRRWVPLVAAGLVGIGLLAGRRWRGRRAR